MAGTPGKPDGWILFVRHSESCANQLKAAYSEQKGLQKLSSGIAKLGYRDPELTELGEKWALTRGEQLAPYVSPTTQMFASTLFRTQLTALLIREGIQKTKPKYNPTITILPNSSEVSGFSYFERDNAPLNSADFVSFGERMQAYKDHRGPRYEEKIGRITSKKDQFNTREAQIKNGASSSSVSELLKWLNEKRFLIDDTRNVGSPVTISGLTPIAITQRRGPMPNKVTVDHLDAIIVSHGGVMKTIIEKLGGKRPELDNLDAILFRIKDGEILAAYLMPMPDKKSALELGVSEIDKSCLRNECQRRQNGGRTRRNRIRSRRHRRRGQGRP